MFYQKQRTTDTGHHCIFFQRGGSAGQMQILYIENNRGWLTANVKHSSNSNCNCS